MLQEFSKHREWLAYGHVLIYEMSSVVYQPGEADDVLNIPIQVLHADIKLQPASQTAVVSINVLPCKLAARQPSLNSCRGLWASLRSSAV